MHDLQIYFIIIIIIIINFLSFAYVKYMFFWCLGLVFIACDL